MSHVEQHHEIIDGRLGTHPGKVHVRVDGTVCPTVMQVRHIPVAIRPKLKDKLDRMKKLGVITKVNEPTLWLVVVTKIMAG